MSNIFSKFRNKEIPVINWYFFKTLKEGANAFNEKTWGGWIGDWKPVATNDVGDAIVLLNNGLYEVQHDTGKPPKPKLVTDNLIEIETLFKALRKYKGFTEKETIDDLRSKKEYLINLKKSAPRSLKYDFTVEIDDLNEAISEKKWENSKEGKFLKVAAEIQKTALAELRQNERYSDIRLLRREKKLIFYIAGKLNKNESLDEIMSVFNKYSFSSPIEYELDSK